LDSSVKQLDELRLTFVSLFYLYIIATGSNEAVRNYD
jgi:hypothetical protein